MKKLILITMLFAPYAYAMVQQEPAARITSIENETNSDVVFQINGQKHTIAKNSTKKIKLPLTMQPMEHTIAHYSNEFKSKQTMAIIDPKRNEEVISFQFISYYNTQTSQYHGYMKITEHEYEGTFFSDVANLSVLSAEKPTYNIDIVIRGYRGRYTAFDINAGV